MRSIIKQIYDGDLCSCERKVACISEFRAARDIAVQAHDAFEDKLCQPMKQEFDERAKGDRLEQLYEAAYYYWYNRLRKLKRRLWMRRLRCSEKKRLSVKDR